MTTFENVLRDVFENGAEVRFADPAEEIAAIEAAKTGDESATLALLYAYAPALRSAVKSYRDSLGEEDARSEAVGGLLAAIHAFDPEKSDRLAGNVYDRITDALAAALSAQVTFSIPERTLQRFYGIVRRADGDLDRAAEIAERYQMTRETFYAVLSALRVESLDLPVETQESSHSAQSARPIWGPDDGFADAEDRVLVEAAFRAVDEREEGVIRDAYGFSEYRPLPDGEIAQRRGMTRPTVQRTRARGLGKMRDALAVDVVA